MESVAPMREEDSSQRHPSSEEAGVRDVDWLPEARIWNSPERSSVGIGLERSAVVRFRSDTSMLVVVEDESSLLVLLSSMELRMVCCCRRRVLDGTNDGVNETVDGRQWRRDNVKTVSGRREMAVCRLMVILNCVWQCDGCI